MIDAGVADAAAQIRRESAWELAEGGMYRCRVEGGWVYCFQGNRDYGFQGNRESGITFVPEPPKCVATTKTERHEIPLAEPEPS